MKNNKLFLVFFLTFIGLSNLMAQAVVKETRMSVMDADRPAFGLDFNYDAKIVQDAWDLKMGEYKLKGKNQKGLDTYEGVKFPDIHYENIDMFCKIEKVDKGRTSLTLTVSKGYGNFLTDADAKIIENTKNFLSRFATHVDQYKLKLDIKAQEDLIKDTQKNYDKLVDEGKKLQDEIEKNKANQEAKVKELEAANKLLEELKSKVK